MEWPSLFLLGQEKRFVFWSRGGQRLVSVWFCIAFCVEANESHQLVRPLSVSTWDPMKVSFVADFWGCFFRFALVTVVASYCLFFIRHEAESEERARKRYLLTITRISWRLRECVIFCHECAFILHSLFFSRNRTEIVVLLFSVAAPSVWRRSFVA